MLILIDIHLFISRMEENETTTNRLIQEFQSVSKKVKIAKQKQAFNLKKKRSSHDQKLSISVQLSHIFECKKQIFKLSKNNSKELERELKTVKEIKERELKLKIKETYIRFENKRVAELKEDVKKAKRHLQEIRKARAAQQREKGKQAWKAEENMQKAISIVESLYGKINVQDPKCIDNLKQFCAGDDLALENSIKIQKIAIENLEKEKERKKKLLVEFLSCEKEDDSHFVEEKGDGEEYQ